MVLGARDGIEGMIGLERGGEGLRVCRLQIWRAVDKARVMGSKPAIGWAGREYREAVMDVW
jgi:hypothetical protein